jgi:hypothetical protein
LGLAEWRAFRDLQGKPDEEEEDEEEEKEVVVVVRGNNSHKGKAGWWAAAATLLGGGRRCLVGDGGGKVFGGERKVGGNENLGRETLCYRFDFFLLFIFKLVNPGWVNQRNRGLWMQSTATILKFENLRFQKI